MTHPSRLSLFRRSFSGSAIRFSRCNGMPLSIITEMYYRAISGNTRLRASGEARIPGGGSTTVRLSDRLCEKRW